MSASTDLPAAAAAITDHLTRSRRTLHGAPELGLVLPQTQALVLSELERIGVDSVVRGKALSSVVAEVRGSAPGPRRTVALRADMDALPLSEHNDLPFASRHAGCMHACGHDAHVAMLLGAAELLAARRHAFAGTVRLLFQPGEEGFGGAAVMIDEGALDGVDAAFALHVEPSTPEGILGVRRGTIMASADTFRVVFRGAGGHASMPHFTRDPIPAIGPFVDGLSHVAARETDPDDRAVLSVTLVRAGTTTNVIPPEAECAGTIRTLSPGRRAAARQAVERVARGVAAARGLEVQVEFQQGYPPTVNHDEGVERMKRAASSVGLRVHDMPSSVMGAEDFSYMLEKVPGAFAFLGARIEGGGPLHSDLMKIDEAVLPRGAAVHAALALDFLAGDAAAH